MAVVQYVSNVKKNARPFNVPMWLLKPALDKVKGTIKKSYPEEGELIFCAFRTFGGTETQVNGVTVVEDTVVIDTWYRPDITSDCRLKAENGNVYELLGTPENLYMNNKFLRFKIRRLGGTA
jgi:hypothetical protein